MNSFPVVCVHGSTDRVDNSTHLPDNNDAAIVVVNHVRSPATMLHEILLS